MQWQTTGCRQQGPGVGVAHGQLQHTARFTDLQPQRLPPGRWVEHQVEIEGAARVTSVVLCSTTEELSSV